MNASNTPYEYYKGTLGVKVLWLVNDEKGKKKKHPQSLSFIKYRSLSHRMSSKTCIEKSLRSGSWSADALVEFNSLCREWKKALELKFPKPKEQAKKSYFAKHYEADRDAFNYFCAYRFGKNNERKLDPETIEIYTYNASVLNTVIQVKNNRKAYKKALGDMHNGDIWESLSRDVNAFREVNHDLPTTAGSLRYKVTKYQKTEYKSIVSKKYGTRNRAKVKNQEQIALLEEILSHNNNLNNEQVAWWYNLTAKKAGWQELTASAVASWREKLGLYIYAGTRGLTNFEHQKMMQVKRKKPSLPMLFWSMDGWNTELAYQKTSINKKGHKETTYHHRLTAVMIVDVFNYYIVGYAIGERENPNLIREALKNAINHTKELFGERYKPYQLQSDNYQIKNLESAYKSATKFFTPARVGNAKAKPIEPFFDRFNEEYFQKMLVPNWTGHNITSRSENQPSESMLRANSKNFPDKLGAKMQIINAINQDRNKKVQAYIENWQKLPVNDRIVYPLNQFLRQFGSTTGYTNKLTGTGITPTINGELYYYENFDLNFRKYGHIDWCLYYDETDLSQVLAVNAESRNGKLVDVVDTMEFVLEQKYEPAMALYDQQDGKDMEFVHKVSAHGKELKAHLLDRSNERQEILSKFLTERPELDTLQKFVLPSSTGRHKELKQEAISENSNVKSNKVNKKPPFDTDDYEIVEDYRDDY